MRPEDFDKAKKLIEQSTSLSQVEKAEWTQLLPKMNDMQVLELIKILTPKQPDKVLPPWELSVNPKEKEISTTRPEFEPELPPPPGSMPKSQPSQPTAKPTPSTPFPAPPVHMAPSPRSPEELQKLVEQISTYKPTPSQTPPQPPKPVMPPQPQQTPLQASAHKPEGQFSPSHIKELLNNAELQKSAHDGLATKMASIPMIPLRAPDDFARISAGMLHGKDPVAGLQDILNSMAAVGQKSGGFSVVSNFQKSPLNKTYVEFGIALLNDPNEDRNIAFENVSRDFKTHGKDYLTKQEFEIFTDFRKQVDKLFL